MFSLLSHSIRKRTLSRFPAAFHHAASDIQVLYVFRVSLNKFATRLNLIPHQGGKCQIQFRMPHRHPYSHAEGYGAPDPWWSPRAAPRPSPQTFVALDLIVIVTADFLDDLGQFFITVGIPDLLVLLQLV